MTRNGALGTPFDAVQDMFIDRLLNQGNAPLIGRMLDFTSSRHKLLAENIANASTPGYVQKDLSVTAFQAQIRDRLVQKRSAPPGSIGFGDIAAEPENPKSGLLFHDRNNRSMEQLMSDLSSNALKHNMYSELLRKQYDSIHTVLKERIA